MHDSNGATTSLWQDIQPPIPANGQQAPDMTVDVCIVGAGISGLSVAYMLSQAGKKVVVLDDDPIGGTMTSRTTAHLFSALDDRFYKLERLFGETGSQLAAESHTRAIDKIEEIVLHENIDCEFKRVDGYLFSHTTEDSHELDKELEAAQRAGFTDAQKVDFPPQQPQLGPAICFPRQGQFQPLAYVAGLAKAIQAKGGLLYDGTHVSKIQDDESQPYVETAHGTTIKARHIVVATNSPMHSREFSLKQAQYMTYAIGVRIPPNSFTPTLYWDTQTPGYHYVRSASSPAGKNDLLIIGGEDHKVGQDNAENKHFDNLEKWAKQHFPNVENRVYQWSGEYAEPMDSLAFIGLTPFQKSVYMVTGDSGQGMTHGTIAGILVTDLILGRNNPWAELYDPSRRNLHPEAMLTMMKEGINANLQFADYLRSGEISSPDELDHGQGAIMSKGLRKIAVYKDDEGKIHQCSAICTHWKGVVRWNNAEKTWDCPLHGSRFNACGKLIQGPANKDLDPVE
ncbi:FAD-dependent oxidoreductase [Alkanindiges illinoisensis]|uniref:FAD-dependent oxidoreductase n=1 Tax=Alkanindiges illinoisensis TaxID=197183 RepID=A0A4Y7XEJ8_9GAMM|nr:FAD-dependent oxidoreductase [Alkanindiges illinoisensis]TEU30163.1 FAD-dependent oxidoreductase [Alkanindiges illinoisensis]